MRQEITKVNILGTDYTIKQNVAVKTDSRLTGADGMFDFSTKEIKIAKFVKDEQSIHDIDSHRRKVLRHEIIHAFLYESGLYENSSEVTAWAANEEMVDWIAMQSPKIFKVFKELGIDK